jgi:hypothetical protein
LKEFGIDPVEALPADFGVDSSASLPPIFQFTALELCLRKSEGLTGCPNRIADFLGSGVAGIDDSVLATFRESVGEVVAALVLDASVGSMGCWLAVIAGGGFFVPLLLDLLADLTGFPRSVIAGRSLFIVPKEDGRAAYFLNPWRSVLLKVKGDSVMRLLGYR